MNEAAEKLITAALALPAEERAEITHRLWLCLPNIKSDLFTHYEQGVFEEIIERIEEARQSGSSPLSATGVELCNQFLGMEHDYRIAAAHALWPSLPSMRDLFGEEDPEFIAELYRRIDDAKSGKTKSVPHEEVMARMKEKYG